MNLGDLKIAPGGSAKEMQRLTVYVRFCSMDQMPITSKIVLELAKANDDFAFELKIGRILRSRNDAIVAHGGAYSDHRTGVTRQFDYQCTIRSGLKLLHLAVECKNVFSDAPVVLCGHQRVASESFHDVICAARGKLVSDNGAIYGGDRAVAEIHPQMPSALYPTNKTVRGFVGKSVFIAKPPKARAKGIGGTLQGYTAARDDDVYDRWNQALGSAAAIAIDALEFDPVRASSTWVMSLVLPVVVVPSSALWQVEFGEDGATIGEAQAVDGVTLFRAHSVSVGGKFPSKSISLSHIHFFTEKGLALFLHDLGTFGGFWDYSFPEQVGIDFFSRLRG